MEPKRSVNTGIMALFVASCALIIMVLSITTIPIVYVKYLGALLVLLLFVLFPYPIFSMQRILFVIALVFFPITLTIFGKDALTTATGMILLLALLFFIRVLFQQDDLRKIKLLFRYILLLLIAGYGTYTISAAYWGPAFRHFLNFFTALTLFFILINTPHVYRVKNVESFVDMLISLVLILFSIEALIGVAVYVLPGIGGFFSAFLVRTEEVLEIGMTLGQPRMRSIILDPESLGESVAMLAPLVIYKALNKSKRYWWLYFFLLAAVVLSNTRSGVILFVLGTAITFFIYRRRFRFWNLVSVVTFSVFLSGLVLFLFPQIVMSAGVRFSQARDAFYQGADIVTILNRHFVWGDAWRVTSDTLSLFGNGQAPSHILGLNKFNFHSLYLTLVYQFGIVGAVLYLSVLAEITFRLIQNRNRGDFFGRARLRSACIVSMFIFFLNEIKYEFNRGDSYQQACWVLFALFFLISYSRQNKQSPSSQPSISSSSHAKL